MGRGPDRAGHRSRDGIVVSPTGGVLEGREQIERIYKLWLTAFPDLVYEVSDVIVDGHTVVLLATITGTHAGDFFGLAPTGRRVEVSTALIYKLHECEIAHERRILDFTGVLVQVGVLKTKPA